MKCELIFLLLFSVYASTERKSFNGYKVYRLYPSTEEHMEIFPVLYTNTHYDFWNPIREPNEEVIVSVSGRAQPSFENLLRNVNATYEEYIPKLNRALNKERQDLDEAPKIKNGDIDFMQYHSFEKILAYLKNLEKTYGRIVTLETIGRSVQGREIVAVKISKNRKGAAAAILIDAGLSPREWIGPAQALYVIKSLVEVSTNDVYLDYVDWYIIPLVNPDGYVYSHKKHRLWRKNLSPGKEEIGTHLNRNFDINWGVNHSSSLEIDWNYQGSKPFSEPETIALKTFIEKHARQIKLYLSLHSFGPNILYPFGYTREPPANVEVLQLVAKEMAESFKRVSGAPYVSRPASSEYFLYSGSSMDWAVAKAGIELAFILELPSAGYTGFDFPPRKILSVVQDTFIGLLSFHKFVEDRYVMQDPGRIRDEL